MGTLNESTWELVHSGIAQAAKVIAEAGQYDDAIFAAFRYVEADIQQRIGSKSVGIALLDEAFDGSSPRIRISDDKRDQEGAKKLFEGALISIRNDRGHKKTPSLPCTSGLACVQHLSFASLLLYLLDKDRNTYPRIHSLRLLGVSAEPRVEVIGNNFSANSAVVAEDTPVQIVRLTPTSIEALLPAQFSGELSVVAGEKVSNAVYCDATLLTNQAGNRYEVIRAEIPLYEDTDCTQRRAGVVGLLIRATEGEQDFMRVIPTPPFTCKAGCYVTHGPFSEETVGPTATKRSSVVPTTP